MVVLHRLDFPMSRDDDADRAARVLALKQDVMCYLLEHPDAKDTAEGIREWWLAAGVRGLRQDDLDDALTQLLDAGWLTTASFGETTVYGLDHARRDDIRRWLES
jgi:hypothetical protein